jgi:arylsulfatase A
MTRRGFLAAASSLAFAQSQKLPLNFVIVLVDDFGATDLSCYGSKFYRTPNLDRLATEGMRFTQAYSACTVCSPSRAAIMTGKYPARLHITDWIAGTSYPWAKLKPPDWTMYLSMEERTIAEALKPLGYATGLVGKWHLAPPGGDPDFTPEKQGFDVNRAGTFRGAPPSYFSPYEIETLEDGPEGEYLTDREQVEASDFIRRNQDKPFFLYLPHHTVHTPLQAKQALIEKYKALADDKAPQNNPVYAAMIESLDQNIGKLMETLEEAGVAERTVVIVTGDNGGHLPSTKTNLGLRAGKGSPYEGGIRVPLIVRWPGMVRAGSTCDRPVAGYDLYPTILEMAGAKPEPKQIIDGKSIVPLLRNSGTWRRRPLFWHYPHYHPGGSTPHSIIRGRSWKLIRFYENNRFELYDLRIDPEEKTNLFEAEPVKANALRLRLNAWLKETGAQFPVPNPDYDSARAGLTAAQAKARGLL